jgi:hypothetical protein
MNLAHCQRCAKQVSGHEVISLTMGSGTEDLCTQCFNAEVADRYALVNFDNSTIDPNAMTDAAGVRHTFHFQSRLMGPNMVVLEAYELEGGAPAGYLFQMIAEPDEERFKQLGRLVQKVRRALATRYLEDTALGLQIKDMEVRGQIEADTSDEGSLFASRMPALIVDGKEVGWEDFGRMLAVFEGCQFKLQIVDPSDDLG